jgi:5'-nucleotidase
MKRALSILAAVFAVASAPVLAEDLHRGRVDVNLLAINDFHGNIATERYTTAKGRRVPVGGAPWLAARFRSLKASLPNTLLVEAGDMVGASPLESALFQDEPTVEFLNMAGFDAGTLGNHELDEGVAEAKRLWGGGAHPRSRYYPKPFPGARFPLVCANLLDERTGKPIFPPYVVKRVGGVRIGFIGAITEELPTVVTVAGLRGVRQIPVTTAVNRWAAHLKRYGVRSIVALVHEGGAQSPEREGGELTGPIRRIVEALDPEVDVVVCGHTHRYHNTFVGKVLVTQARNAGDAFARISLTVDRGSGDIVRKRAEVEYAVREGVTPAPDVRKMVDGYVALAAPRVNKVLGRLDVAMPARGKEGDSPLGNYIADAQRVVCKADIAFMNPGGIRAGLPKGNVTYGDLYAVHPFGNTITVLTMRGSLIRETLEQQWGPGSGGRPRETLLFVSGLKYSYDPNGPYGSRVRDVTLSDGSPLSDDREYLVAVNSFLAGGGDEFTAFTKAARRVAGPLDLDVLTEYMKTCTVAPGTGRVTELR